MRYVIAILLPPLAVLLCGKIFQFLINLILTLLLWIPGMIHALFVVHDFYDERRTRRIENALKKR